MTRTTVLGVCALAAIHAIQDPPPRFRSGTESVSVDVLVLDGNRPVAGLSTSAFDLRDSGVRQSITAVEMRDVPVSLMLALDTSNSVRGPMLRRLAEATRAAIDTLGPNDRAALLTFNEAVVLRADWGATAEALQGALQQIEGGGFTALTDAASAALTLRDVRPGTRAMVLIFSDGEDTISWLPEQAVLEKARRTDAVVYTVGESTGLGRPLEYGSGVQLWPRNPRALREAIPFFKELADVTGGVMFRTPRGASLGDTFRKVVTDFRSRYVLTYTPEGVDARGWHPIEVRLKGTKGRVRARRGYSR